MDREQDDIVNRLRGLLREAVNGEVADVADWNKRVRAALAGSAAHQPNAETREAMEEARGADQPNVAHTGFCAFVLDGRPCSCGADGANRAAHQPAVPLRELCDIAYDHLLAAGYPKDGPVLTQIATGCTPGQQTPPRITNWDMHEFTADQPAVCLHDFQPDGESRIRPGTVRSYLCRKCGERRATPDQPAVSPVWWQERGYVLAYPGCPGAWRVKPEDMPPDQQSATPCQHNGVITRAVSFDGFYCHSCDTVVRPGEHS
jgi:hypothetical protein